MESIDERILLPWLAGALAVASAVGLGVGVADALLVGTGVWVGPAAFVVATFLGSLYAAVRYRTYRFEYDGDVLYLESGVLARARTVVPVRYVRRVDVRRGPLGRLIGLATLVVYVEGPATATVAIPGLSAERARTLQERLRTELLRAEPSTAPRP